MSLFESLLTLTFIAAVLLRLSHRLGIPYPTMLALAGAGVAALPFAPAIRIDPELAMALFIPPALFDVAYDTAPRELRHLWPPLLSLAVVAVVLTTGVVAWVGWAVAGLPVAVSAVLGAIVAPPDAAAASAAMSRLSLPRRAMAILEGESLLNDAAALLIFGFAMHAAMQPGSSGAVFIHLLVAAPGGIAFGIVFGIVYLQVREWFSGTMGARIIEFGSTWTVWLAADHLQLSPILAVVAFAMYLGQCAPNRISARDRIHSYSVWASAVFVLNVLAFLLMGMQARSIATRLGSNGLAHAIFVAGLILVAVILVRVVWVLIHDLIVRYLVPQRSWIYQSSLPDRRIALVISWSGMRGLVTLATALALPETFPGRDIIVLAAFAVVLGTLVLQGLTIGPLISLLKISPDESLHLELSKGRAAVIDAALNRLSQEEGHVAITLREEYYAQEGVARGAADPQGKTEFDLLRLSCVEAQRSTLFELRQQGDIAEDVFHRLEQELDWTELSATPLDKVTLDES
jgi:Na+/H+ antiporter